MILSLLTTTLLLLARPGASSPSPSHCKTYPGDAGWPSLADWRTLNRTVGGNLFAYVPLGSVCSSTSSQYDAAGCASVRSKWVTQALVQADPGLVRATTYTNNTCNPPAVAVGAPCTQGYYPEYVLQAKNRRDIAAVVRFAKKRNLRLNIKNTGHVSCSALSATAAPPSCACVCFLLAFFSRASPHPRITRVLSDHSTITPQSFDANHRGSQDFIGRYVLPPIPAYAQQQQ